ncbi:MAG: hypothetical protein HPY75_05965 [Actinobacteria bacterium]|nr:hypothetical protein [Actinomycetota bacterium]
MVEGRGGGGGFPLRGIEGRLEIHIENACLPFMLVGMAKGLYELLLDKESSRHKWEFLPDGDLHISLYE